MNGLTDPPDPDDIVRHTEPEDRTYRALPEMLTPAEVGQFLRISAWTVRQWIGHGQLQAVRLPGGRHLRISRTELIRALHASDNAAAGATIR